MPMHAKPSDSTRDTILDAAHGEIHRQGFQAASIANILAKTGLTKGALYHHFPAKHDLGLAVIEEIISAGMQAMVFDPLRESDDPLAALLEVIERKGETADLESVRLGCPLNNLMQEMSPLDDEFKNRLLAVLKLWQESVADALQRAQTQGRIRKDVDSMATALFIVASWEGCVGVAKNMQSVQAYGVCMQQLHDYVAGLQVPVRRKPA
jgi:TetR/AcrR family transcriptional regulator, transcriptional repressor for nem operon